MCVEILLFEKSTHVGAQRQVVEELHSPSLPGPAEKECPR